ncbi:MAG: hypothetical protein K6E98_09810 [Lachnospiraceae bacterium]|nr:hypothetical protein [Lachnospiraceae bacterium]
MAKKLGKFLAFTAVVGVACSAVYYVLGKKKGETEIPDDDSSEFFEHNEREYVSLNNEDIASEVKEDVAEVKEDLNESKEAIMNKLNEAAKEMQEKAKDVADGVGLVKDNNTESIDFRFENLKTEED